MADVIIFGPQQEGNSVGDTKKKQHICEEVINEVLCNFAKHPFQKKRNALSWAGKKRRKLFNRPNFTFPSSNRTRCVCLSVPHSN